MNTNAHTLEVNARNFQSEVAEKSQQLPVLLEFYADNAPPQYAEDCAEASRVLGRLVAEYQGKFILARVNIQENPQLVQQLGVRVLPTVKLIFQGQIAQEQAGPIEESRLRSILDQLTLSPMERVREEIDQLLAQGDRHQAIAMLQQVIAQEPKNYGMHAELSDLFILEGRLAEAREMLVALPDDTEGINKPKNRLAFIDEAETLPAAAELALQIEAAPDNPQPAYELAIRLIADGNIEPALEALLNILKKHQLWEDELARKTMIKVFDMLGKGDELATSYRRKMFTFLH